MMSNVFYSVLSVIVSYAGGSFSSFHKIDVVFLDILSDSSVFEVFCC